MSRNVIYDDFKELLKRLEQAAKVSPAFVEKLTNQIAARLLRSLKKNTPTYETPAYAKPIEGYTAKRTGGALKKGWKSERVQVKGDTIEIIVFNPVKYASYANYGHRQKPGRFIPQLGLRLKKSWVQGQFFMEKSEEEIKRILETVIWRQVDAFLEEVIGGR